MSKIVKVLRETQPKALFIGKKYDPEKWSAPPDVWETAFAEGWFDTLEELVTEEWKAAFPEWDAYIGLEYARGISCDEYWVGMWLPVGTAIPAGFGGLEFPECTLATAYVKGNEEDGEVYGCEAECLDAFLRQGMMPRMEGANFWIFERYACPRFTSPDAEGNVILDMCCIVD